MTIFFGNYKKCSTQLELFFDNQNWLVYKYQIDKIVLCLRLTLIMRFYLIISSCWSVTLKTVMVGLINTICINQ